MKKAACIIGGFVGGSYTVAAGIKFEAAVASDPFAGVTLGLILAGCICLMAYGIALEA